MNKIIKGLLSVLVIISLIGLLGCSQKQAATQENDIQNADKISQSVSIKNFAFNPSTLEIAKGTTVTWTNEDSASHTVTNEGVFDSRTLNNGQTFSYKFEDSGEFDYVCSIHPSMKGKIVVK